MGEAMLRTSYSQILNSSRDFSLAICDISSRLIAQADHIPGSRRRADLGDARGRGAFSGRRGRATSSCSTIPITAAAICPI